MSINIDALKVNEVHAIGNRVLVTDMYFGEQRTKSGLIIKDDNGQTRGIYPRWARVYAKGPENNDDYNIGDWILVEHGRWTRGIK
jgi:co-chaperonin GroES (HSP10)